jgi:hypothetical protein
MAFCAGPVGNILRMWGSGVLIYDSTNPSQVIQGGVEFNFHPGSDSETPEPYIADWVSKNVPDASGAVPAFRGLCYVMFQDFPMSDFSNSIPSITAEITTVNSWSPSLKQFTNIEPVVQDLTGYAGGEGGNSNPDTGDAGDEGAANGGDDGTA